MIGRYKSGNQLGYKRKTAPLVVGKKTYWFVLMIKLLLRFCKREADRTRNRLGKREQSFGAEDNFQRRYLYRLPGRDNIYIIGECLGKCRIE